jgi:hypothetical protein
MAGMETVSAAHTLQMYWVISNMTLASMSMQILVISVEDTCSERSADDIRGRRF